MGESHGSSPDRRQTWSCHQGPAGITLETRKLSEEAVVKHRKVVFLLLLPHPSPAAMLA